MSSRDKIPDGIKKRCMELEDQTMLYHLLYDFMEYYKASNCVKQYNINDDDVAIFIDSSGINYVIPMTEQTQKFFDDFGYSKNPDIRVPINIDETFYFRELRDKWEEIYGN